VKPPFPYYGGKQMLAEQIIDLLPEHRHYVEPYAGSLSVLLAKPRVKFETVNDLDGDLVNFWEVLRRRADELEIACGLTPHSRAEHDAAKKALKIEPIDDELERARKTWVLLSQGRPRDDGGGPPRARDGSPHRSSRGRPVRLRERSLRPRAVPGLASARDGRRNREWRRMARPYRGAVVQPVSRCAVRSLGTTRALVGDSC
jgi:hypothetical protein